MVKKHKKGRARKNLEGQSLHTLSGTEGIVLDFMLKYLPLLGALDALGAIGP